MHLVQTMTRKDAFFTMLRSETPRVYASIVFALLATLVEFIPWIAVYLAIETIMNQGSVVVHSVVIAAALLVRYVFYIAAVWQAHLVAYHVIQKVRQHMVKVLSTMPLEQLQRYKRADLEKRISSDCQQLEPLIAHHGTDVINGLLMPILLSFLLFYIDWRIALIAFIPLPIAATIQFLMMKGFSGRFEKYQSIVATMHSAQLEFLRSIGVMKLFAVDAQSYQQLHKAMEKHNKLVSSYTKQLITAWVGFITIAQMSFILVVPVAIGFTMQGQLSIAELIMISAITAGLLKPWLDLTQVSGQAQQSFLCLDRLIPMFGYSESNHALYSGSVQTLSCQKLYLDRGEQSVLRDINASLSSGDRVFIQGPSGCGKSSLIEVLTGALSATQGGWYINDQAVSTLTDQNRAEYVAVVSQQSQFFSGSIRDNLLLASPTCDDMTVWKTLDRLELTALIRALPNQLDTDMGETHRTFSGGEMQRLAIARALLAHTPILVLDEATAHLDQKSELSILDSIHHAFPEQIQIIINHRTHGKDSSLTNAVVSTMIRPTQHWTIDNGSLKECTHG